MIVENLQFSLINEDIFIKKEGVQKVRKMSFPWKRESLSELINSQYRDLQSSWRWQCWTFWTPSWNI